MIKIDERMNKMLSSYKGCFTDEDVTNLIAELRDNFLNHNAVSAKLGYDISTETATGPEHVIYYIAEYISILENRLKEKIALNHEIAKTADVIDERNQRLIQALEEIKKEETVTTGLPKGKVAYTRSGHIAKNILEELR